MQLTQTEVDRLAESARELGRLGLDTEFMPEGRYKPLLCLVQIVVGEHVEVLDPLVDSFDPAPLAEVLADPEIEIVLHAGRQDVAILRREWQTTFTNVFDTQVAAGFAGFSAQAGYNGLLHDVLRIRLPKTASFTRWDARPLTEEQISLRARRRRAPAAAGRRHPGTAGRARPARVGARGVRRDRRGHRRARPGRGLAPAAAGERARPARARRRAGARGLARAHRGEGGPAGRRDPARPDRGRAGQAPAAGRRDLSQIRGITPDVVRRRGDDVMEAIERRPAGRADQARGGRPLADRGRRRPDDRARGVAGALARAGGRPGLRADRGPRRPLAGRRRRPPRTGRSRRCARCRAGAASSWARSCSSCSPAAARSASAAGGARQGHRGLRPSSTAPEHLGRVADRLESPPAMIIR